MAATTEVCDYASAVDFLFSRINYERAAHIPYASDFKLSRMRRLLAHLGDPHLSLKAIHIAGTKGKGSTAAMVASILQAAGKRTGLYTSPHLARVEERLTVDGNLCEASQFVDLVAEVQRAAARLQQDSGPAADSGDDPTFFEVTTALAFLHFARQRVDAAVLEVGLGGRLDSTNVCLPQVCIITSISFDHMRQLGNTLAAIASEKAGIIKSGVPVVSGVTSGEARAVIAARAEELSAPLYERGRDFDGQRLESPKRQHRSSPQATAQSLEQFDYREPASSPHTVIRGLPTAMIGAHQISNAACAVAAVRRLCEQGWDIEEEAIRRGLAAGSCPARVEFLPGEPSVVIDVAHNPASIAALLDVIRERFGDLPKVLVFASSRDKDYAAMLKLVVGEFDTLILTQYKHNPRAADEQDLARIAAHEAQRQNLPRLPRIETAAEPAEAWRAAVSAAAQNGLVCITGSFFLAAELRSVVTARKVEQATKAQPGPPGPLSSGES